MANLKVCNLYCGIGGNRKLWDKEHLGFDVDVTAVEIVPEIAKIYQDFFPQDKVIVADAHQYLLEHFKEFEFIWSSPPCPSHSRVRKSFVGRNLDGQNKPIYPDMKLYEEILFLQNYAKCKYVVENVISFYEPLSPPQEVDNHYFWANFHIGYFPQGCREHYGGINKLQECKGFDLSKYSGIEKIKTLRNCVKPNLGLHILNESKRDIQPELFRTLTH